MNTLGERLRYLRDKQGVTAKYVNDTLNINDLGRYEKNEKKPGIDNILALANYYDVSLDWLITGKETIIERNPYKVTLSQDQKELLSYFDKLPYRDQLILIGSLKKQVEDVDMDSAKSKSFYSQKSNSEYAKGIS